MFCKKIDILAVAKEKLCIATIFIRGIKHLEIVIDIKYQYYQTIFRYKKAFLRFGCLCSNATVHFSLPMLSLLFLPYLLSPWWSSAQLETHTELVLPHFALPKNQ